MSRFCCGKLRFSPTAFPLSRSLFEKFCVISVCFCLLTIDFSASVEGQGQFRGGGLLFLLDFGRTCTQSVFICGCKITREIALVARSKTFNERRQGFKEQQDTYDIYRYIYRCIQLYIYRYIQLYLALNLCNTQAAVAAPAQSPS